jgi:hypothetical protein
MSLRQIVIGIMFALAVAGGANTALAQVVMTETQKLHFGKWYFSGDNSPVTISVDTNGVMNVNSPDITMFTAPRPGVYTITGLPANAMINGVNIIVSESPNMGAGTFTVQNFTTSIPDADSNGRTILRIGAELVTAGGGNGYLGGMYNGSIDIEIDY